MKSKLSHYLKAYCIIIYVLSSVIVQSIDVVLIINIILFITVVTIALALVIITPSTQKNSLFTHNMYVHMTIKETW